MSCSNPRHEGCIMYRRQHYRQTRIFGLMEPIYYLGAWLEKGLKDPSGASTATHMSHANRPTRVEVAAFHDSHTEVRKAT